VTAVGVRPFGRRGRRAARRFRSGAALALAFCAALSLGSCATAPAEPEPAATIALSVVGAPVVRAIDVDTVSVSAEILAANRGGRPAALSALRAEATPDGVALAAPVVVELGGRELGPGEELALPVRLVVDAPPGDGPLVPFTLLSVLAYSSTSGSGEARLEVRGEFPRITTPTMAIASIRILKDELINTKLGVELVVRNPNAFPLTFAELDYRLYGEGRYWASGCLAEPFVVPAGEEARASLYLTMNFTDMSRSLLDQVIKLAAVSYRLVGAGRVDTGLEFLPRFELPFDMAGRAEVRR